MGRMLKIEIERALRGYGFWLSLLIGMIISVEHYFRVVLVFARYPLKFYIYDSAVSMPASAFQFWIGAGSSNFEGILFVRLFPILAVMPYASTYVSDIRNGLIKNYYTRTRKHNYLVSKYIVTFITGGMAVTIPLLANFLLTTASLPSIVWPIGVFTMSANCMWSDIFYTNPYLYVLMMLGLMFLCGGFISTFALAFSNLVSNIFVVMLAPFIVCEFTNAMIRLSSISWIRKMAPQALFSISQIAPKSGISYIVFFLIMIVIDIFIYYIGGKISDTF